MSTSLHHLVGIFYTTIWKAEIQRNSWSPLQACLVRVPLGLYVVNMTELKKETNKGLTSTIARRVKSIGAHLHWDQKDTEKNDSCWLLPIAFLSNKIHVRSVSGVTIHNSQGQNLKARPAWMDTRLHRIVFSQMGAQKYTCAFWRLYDPPHCWEMNFNLHP